MAAMKKKERKKEEKRRRIERKIYQHDGLLATVYRNYCRTLITVRVKGQKEAEP